MRVCVSEEQTQQVESESIRESAVLSVFTMKVQYKPVHKCKSVYNYLNIIVKAEVTVNLSVCTVTFFILKHNFKAYKRSPLLHAHMHTGEFIFPLQLRNEVPCKQYYQVN